MKKTTKVYISAAAIAIISFIVYANTLVNGFVYDDDMQVLDNFWIRDFKYIPQVFSKGVWNFASGGNNYYRPLMHVIYMLDYHIFGLHAWGFHLTNILFNMGVSVLVFLITMRLLHETSPAGQADYIKPAFIASLIFLTNPVHTEAVAWVAGIPDLTFSFFYLLSFHFYMRSEKRLLNGSDGFYLLSIFSFYLATLCKEPAVTLPLLLAGYDYTVRRETIRLKRYAPFLLIISLYLLQRAYALRGFAPYTTSIKLSGYLYFINTFPLIADYIRKLLFPFDLNAFHVFHAYSSALDPTVLFSFMPFMAFAAVLLIAYRKRGTAFLGLLFFALPLLPALYIPAIGRNVFTERYLYLPSFGLALLIAPLFVHAGSDWMKKAAVAAVVAISVIFFIGTVERNKIWRNDEVLWMDTVKKSPDSPVPYNGLGNAFMSQGRLDMAMEQFNAAIRLQDNFAVAHASLGNVFNRKGEVGKAIEQYNIALRLVPNEAPFHNNLGVAFGKAGAFDKAVAEFNTAINLRPNYSSAYNNLGLAYKKMGDRKKALEQFRKAVELKPGEQSYLNNIKNINNTAH